ncbi:MAG: ATP-binding protein [Alphaproteobacteria bacterium]
MTSQPPPPDTTAIREPRSLLDMAVFVILVILTGFGISLILFMLVSGEVNVSLAQQVERPLVKTVANIQARINAAYDALESMQQSVQTAAQRSGEHLGDFTAKIKDMHLPFTGIYMLEKNGHWQLRQTLYGASDPAVPLASDEVSAIIAAAERSHQTASSLWRYGIKPAMESDLVFASSCAADTPDCALVATMPLASIADEFNGLINSRVIHGYAIEAQALHHDADRERKIGVIAAGKQHSGHDWLYTAPITRDSVAFKDWMWELRFFADAGSESRLLLFLPYIVIFAGMLLTLALVVYIIGNREYQDDTAGLTRSLQRTNRQLQERIAAEEKMALALRESERKYRAIFDNAGIGICQISIEGQWLKVNKTLARMMGYDGPQDVLRLQPGLTDGLFVDPGIWRRFLGTLDRQDEQADFEVAIKRPNGPPIWVNMRGHIARDDGGTALYYECTMYDVTRRRMTELALITAKEQADFANRSKSEFLANMSHELRTPLNAIIGFSEIIKNQLFGVEGIPQYVEYAKDIYDSGELLLALINDILDMSKIEAGKRALSETALDVERVIQACVRLVISRAKAANLNLTVNVPKDFPPVRAEERALKQILTNLLTNAVKFTPEEGEVTVGAHIDPQGRMCFAVADTGIGIAPEDIATALAPFGQIESVLSRKTQGTGLGLPLTKALVELHGGELKIESALGKGTTVTVTLPPERVVARAG